MIDRNRRASFLAALTAGAMLPLFAAAAVPNPPPTLCVDGAACVKTSATSPSQGIKYHPGHYAWFAPKRWFRIDEAETIAEVKTFIDSIAGESTVKGIQLATLWRALEGRTAGDYSAGFAAMDQILAHAKARNKRVMLALFTGWSGNIDSDYTIFPDYIVNGSSYGITVSSQIAKPTRFARSWQQATNDRIIALVQAYGARYNGNPYLEMVNFGETAIGGVTTDGFSNQALLAQMQRLIVATRAAWPNTGLRIGANDLAPDSLMTQLFTTCEKYACAVGGPDVWPATVTQADRVFAGLDQYQKQVYTDYRDRMPWAIEIQSPELAGQWTPKELYDATVYGYYATQDKFAVPSMKTKYVIWYVNTGWTGGAAQAWSTGELPFIRSTGGNVHSTTCPTTYPSCITN